MGKLHKRKHNTKVHAANTTTDNQSFIAEK